MKRTFEFITQLGVTTAVNGHYNRRCPCFKSTQGQIANGKFTLKSRMLHLIVAISDSSCNERNGTRAMVVQGLRFTQQTYLW